MKNARSILEGQAPGGEDDIASLPIPASAKAYARRKGLKSMERQPKDFIQVVADLTNHGDTKLSLKDVVGPVTQATNRAARKVVEQLLVEMPVSSYNVVGDFSKGHSFTHPVDRRLITHPKVAEKVKGKFGQGVDEMFDLFFVNKKALRVRWQEHGEVSEATLYAKPPKGLGLTPQEVPVNPDHITVVYVGNAASEHEPMTPWIMAHRFAHAISRYTGPWTGQRQVQGQHNFLGMVSDLLKALKPEQSGYEGYSRGSYEDQKYKTLIADKLSQKLIGQALGTFKSARDRNLRDMNEFAHELLAQFLMTGKITLNRLHGIIPMSYSYGKLQTRRMDAAECDDTIDQYEYDLNSAAREAVMDCAGRIFVM